MQKELQTLAEKLWAKYILIFPRLQSYKCPTIIINNRLSKSAGYNFSAENETHLAGKYLEQFPNRMRQIILPHELAHQIDYNLNGWYKGKRHHGKEWIIIMTKIGLPADAYHTMELKK